MAEKAVESRVVSMQFDNAAFERNTKSTLGILDKLKSALNFGKAGKSFDDISASANKVNLSGMASAIENISSKFSVMGAVALSVINNVVTSAISAGTRIVKALALDPVMDGFREYETNMTSIQTILSNTRADGTNLEQVNTALEKLNLYSDQTIYNFAEMARNIGTFTAAGVGLDDSVNAIKGIANLAAISGSNSQQASTAMYQLSQALAAGKVNLMDWNSVVNAGMGGEVFKKALFETGKAMKTITDVPLSASFEEWEKKGGTFREQMEKGWLTADVLKTTLGAFSGDLDASALAAMGFSEAAANEMVELGKLGQAAATEVKTITQLFSTVKESVGSGFAQSFKLVIGDFEEAKKLFTDINTVVSGFVGKMSDARNELISGWRFIGGREKLIEGFKNAFKALGDIIKTIGTAFKDVFPPITVITLAELTNRFAEFTKNLIPSKQTLSKIGDIFRGVFSILAIGIEIVKNVFGVFKELFSSFKEVNGAPLLEFFGDIGMSISNLRAKLVGGGGIQEFFDKWIDPVARFIGSLNFAGAINAVVEGLTSIKDAVMDFFGDDAVTDGADDVSNAVENVGERFNWLIAVGEKLGDLGSWIKTQLKKAAEGFKDLAKNIATALSSGDYSGVLDALNTGIFAGLVLMIRKFVKDGLKLDFGGGLLENISDSFDQLTSTLGALQAQLRADALLKIALAVGVLTVSLVLLAAIDSAALTKALTATAAGFGQLVATMALLGKAVADPRAAAKMLILSIGLIALAGAMVIMALAAKIFASMSWEELAQGLIGVGAMLAGITVAMNKMPDSGMMFKTGLSIAAMAVGVLILAGAAKIFATMSWEELAKGLIGVAGALTAIVVAMNKMPTSGMLKAGVAIIAIAIGIGILAGAVAIFGAMELGALVQGLVGLAVALGIIVIAMAALSGLPMSLPVIGASLILVGIGLAVVTASVLALGSMDLGVLVQGLIGIAAALAILAIGLYAMSGAIPGAVAMTIAAAALIVLAKGIEIMAGVGIGNVLIALLGVAAALAVLAIAALLLQPALPALFGLGAALVVVGAGGLLFGLAALAIATAILLIVSAFEKLAGIQQSGVDAIFAFVDQIIAKLPSLATALVDTLVNIVQGIIDALPELIQGLGKVVDALLDFLIKEIPKLAVTITTLIQTVLALIRANFGDIVKVGLEMIMSLLTGIDENIEEITNKAIDIVTKFINTIAERADDLVDAGLGLITAFLDGIADNIDEVIEAAYGVVAAILEGIGSGIAEVVDAGGDIIIKLLNGIGEKLTDIITAGADVVVKLIEGIGQNLESVLTAGRNLVVSVINGIGEKTNDILTAGRNLILLIMTGIGQKMGDIITKGVDLVVAFINGMGLELGRIISAGKGFIIALIRGIGQNLLEIIDAAFTVVITFINGLAVVIRVRGQELRDAGFNLIKAVVDGMTGGLASKAREVADGFVDMLGGAIDAGKGFLGIRSPSKVTRNMAEMMAAGMALGLRKDKTVLYATEAFMGEVVNTLSEGISRAQSIVQGLEEFNPTITPVLDLSGVERDARQMSNMLNSPLLDISSAIDQAAALSAASFDISAPEETPAQVIEQHNDFSQTINSPKPLNAAEVYRGTKTQISRAQKELETV